MTETARERIERRMREGQEMLETLRRGPYKAEATPAEVLEVRCPTCSAAAGSPCDGSRYSMFGLGLLIRGMGRIHTSRYLAKVRAAAGLTCCPWTEDAQPCPRIQSP